MTKLGENNLQVATNITDDRVLANMSFDELTEPFNQYILRFGFLYVHFKNGGCLMADEFNLLIKDLWNGSKNDYDKKVGKWCVDHCC